MRDRIHQSLLTWAGEVAANPIVDEIDETVIDRLLRETSLVTTAFRKTDDLDAEVIMVPLDENELLAIRDRVDRDVASLGAALIRIESDESTQGHTEYEHYLEEKLFTARGIMESIDSYQA